MKCSLPLRWNIQVWRRVLTMIGFLSIGLCSTLYGQNLHITGTVTDGSNNSPVNGAAVIVKDTYTGVTTDANGHYQITAPPDAVLQFSMLGYDPVEVAVGNRTIIDVTFNVQSTQVEEIKVYAVGYGTTRRDAMTGSVGQVGAAEIAKTPVVSVDQALQGNVSGVVVITTSAEPGADVTIRVRGGSSISADNEPLFVIDGFIADKEAISLLNPNDVQAMDVLKDAAATAIYGSRGANGVILITTKSGRAGNSKLNISTKFGITTPRRYIPMLNSSQFSRYNQAANIAEGKAPTSGSYGANTYMPDTLRTFNGQKEVIDSWAYRTDYALDISGGSDRVNYMASASYVKEKGLVHNSSNDRITGRVRFGFQINDKVHLRLGTSMANDVTESIMGGESGAISRTLALRPTLNSEGVFTDGNFIDPETGEILSSQVDLAVALNSNKKRIRFLGDLNGVLSWDILPNLKFSVSGIYKYNQYREYDHLPRNIFRSLVEYERRTSTYRNSRNYTWWQNENLLTYQRGFGLHNFNVLAGASFEKGSNEAFGVTVKGFDSDYYLWNNLGATTYIGQPVPESSYNANQLTSFFTRVMYNWSNRYYASASFRTDGSSRFGEDNKYGIFPAVSFAWNIMNEPFASGWGDVSSLRLRASFGVTGNQSIPNYTSQTLYTDERMIINGNSYGGITTSTLGNENLQWETTASYNLGADIGLWDNKVSMIVEAYYKKTYNLLYSFRIPSTTGYSNIMRNVGNVDNKGLEFEISTVNIDRRDFSWTTDFNISYNNSKVTDLGGNDNVILYRLTQDNISNDLTYLIVGKPLGAIMAHKTTIYKDWDEVYAEDAIWVEDPNTMLTRPGMIRYHDRNGDGQIDDNDRVYMGQVMPYLTGGLTNTFSYKNFDLSLFIVFSYGNKIIDANVARLDRWQVANYGQTTKALGSYRWSNYYTGDIGNTLNAKYPMPTTSDMLYANYFNNYWVQDGSYIRLKTVSLGYSFPKRWIDNLRMSDLRLSFSGVNLLTLTRYKGMDPEMSSSLGSSNSRLGIDQSSYPAARMYMLQLGITF